MIKPLVFCMSIALFPFAVHSETAGECKKRLGSELECFKLAAQYGNLMCQMARKQVLLSIEVGESPDPERARCPQTQRQQLKPMYDALAARISRKPAAVKSAKAALAAAFAAFDNPSVAAKCRACARACGVGG